MAENGREPSSSSRPLRALVIGGSGFIGKHLVARLTSLGKPVRAVSLSGGFDIVKDSLPLDDIDHVFHLAGRTGVLGGWNTPLDYIETNAYGTARVIEQCRAKRCGLTFLSTFRHAKYPAEKAVNPYVLSKMLGEQICVFYARQYKIRVTLIRATNVYGPGQSTAFLLPQIVSQLLDDRQPEIIVKDLAPRRDYLYIDDLIDAVILSADAPAGSLFDVGSGVAYSVEDVIRLARRLAGIPKAYRSTDEKRENEIDETKADTSAALAVLGWKPKVALEGGLSNLIESMRTCRSPLT